MKLLDWDWDAQNFVEVDYPDEIIAAFINKLRTNKQWWQSPDPGRDVYSMFRPFQDQLAHWRLTHPPGTGVAPVVQSPVSAWTAEQRKAFGERMAKARAAKKLAASRAT